MAIVLALAIGAAYSNSFGGVFVFDDIPSIVENPHLQSLVDSLRPIEGGATVSGRPALNFSFALTYLFRGLDVRLFHLGNLLIHVAGALILFAVVRESLLLPRHSHSTREAATPVAFWSALLWALHPLQTESVTYVVQRAESLAALCMLAALFLFIRGASSPSPWRWWSGSLAALWMGVATKETAAVAPLIIFLYDRALIGGTFAVAWRTRHRYHLAAASIWVGAAWLVLAGHSRGDTAGFEGPARWWEYAAIQCQAIPHYVRLALWPAGLTFDYGPYQNVDWTASLVGASVLLPALLLTVWLLRRSPRMGFPAAAFFLLLAPSSSVVPIAAQVMAEHRMYLPLASITLAVAFVLVRTLPSRTALCVLVGLAAAAGGATWHRNQVFTSERSLWTETVRQAPSNPRAHLNLGEVYTGDGHLAEAEAAFGAALRLQPNYADAHYNLGTIYLATDRPRQAIASLHRALERRPDFGEAAYNLGNAYSQVGQVAEAIRAYEWALRIRPARASVHYNLANALASSQQWSRAIEHYRAALALEPDHNNARFNLANALVEAGRPREAVPLYREVLERNPGDSEAQANLAELQRYLAEP